MSLCFTEADLKMASDIIDSWSESLDRRMMSSRRGFQSSVVELRSQGIMPGVLTLAALAKLADSADDLSVLGLSVTNHCRDFVDSIVELIDSGHVLQAHADLMSTLDRKVMELMITMNRQRALAMLISETIEIEYPGELFAT